MSNTIQSSYVLESENEFERLEEQGRVPGYDCESDFQGFRLEIGASVLDAGCGSGIVSRYLAERFPQATVTGCDVSERRVAQARVAAAHLANVQFVACDLARLPFEEKSFDVIICRYVLHHLSKEHCARICREFLRVLKPGGKLISIEPDGIFDNLYPMPKVVREVMSAVKGYESVDLYCGRKMPAMLIGAGFELNGYEIQTFDAQGERRALELGLMRQRLSQLIPVLSELVGSRERAESFRDEFLATLESPSSTYFHNKFIVTATNGVTRAGDA